VSITWKDYAGMTAAPAAWAAATQLGQILPYADCVQQMSYSLIVVAAGLAVALAGVVVSYVGQNGTDGRTRVFAGRLSIGIGLAFAFALVLQGAATLLLSPCQR
jgi:hypothetical protein